MTYRSGSSTHVGLMTDKRPLNSLFVGYQTSDARTRSIVVPMSKNCHPAIKINNGRARALRVISQLRERPTPVGKHATQPRRARPGHRPNSVSGPTQTSWPDTVRNNVPPFPPEACTVTAIVVPLSGYRRTSCIATWKSKRVDGSVYA